MVVKLYISGISGNKEVKTKQQRVQMILDSKQISYEAIDITEPGKEKDKEFMQQYGKVRERLGKHPLPPQIFNDDHFCGDYEDFDLANEVDELEKFLQIETKDLENGSKVNGIGDEVSDPSKADEEESAGARAENHKVNGLNNGDAAVSEPPPCDEDDKCDDSNPPQTNELDDGRATKEEEKGEEEEEAEEENGVEVAKRSDDDDGNVTKEDERQAEDKTAEEEAEEEEEEEETNDGVVDEEKEQEE